MSGSGKGNELPTAVSIDLSDGLDTWFVAPMPSFHVDLISEMQPQIKANHALVLSLREELQQRNVAGLATSTFGH